MHQIIPVAGPWITDKEIAYVTDAVAHGWNERANEYIQRFESAFAARVGRRYALSLPSCTSGLHLSLLALGIGPGDEVIVPDLTWIASAAPISYVGATPIFADTNPATWCLSPQTVAPLVTPRTKAIISVNLYGNMPPYEALLGMGLPVIEDAAESLGSLWGGGPSGSFGVTSCFSFHGSKTLTTGEGGMVVMDDEHLWHRCAILRDHGRLPGDILFQNQEVGHKYKMSNLQAALGLAQLERLEELVARKREIFFWHEEEAHRRQGVVLNPSQAGLYNSYWMTTILLDPSWGLDKFEWVRRLGAKGIATRPFFAPLSSLKAYEKSLDGERAARANHHAYAISSRGLNLPSGAQLTRQDVATIWRVLDEVRRSA